MLYITFKTLTKIKLQTQKNNENGKSTLNELYVHIGLNVIMCFFLQVTFAIFMQAIHAETEQSDENEFARLIVERMLNYDRESVLSTSDSVENEKAYEIVQEKPKLEVAEVACLAYEENFREDMKLEENTATNTASNAAPYTDLVQAIIIFMGKCIKCNCCNCRWVC